ncbi:MAG: hypothetical protein WCW13_02575 [archaeon]|jgi:hypothetical protein
MDTKIKFKGVLVLLLLLVFSISVYSSSTTVPWVVQSGSSFLISIRVMSASAFTSTQVFYDNKLLATIDNTPSISIDPTNGKFVLKSFVVDDGVVNAYLSYVEKSSTSHTIKVMTYNGSDLLSEENKTFSVVDNPFTSADITTRLSSVESTLATIQTSINSLTSDNISNKSSISSLSSSLQSVISDVAVIKSSLNISTNSDAITVLKQRSIDEKIASLETTLKEQSDKIAFLEQQLMVQSDELEKSSKISSAFDLNGLFGAASNFSPIILILAIIGLIGFVIVKKFNSNSGGLRR